MMWEHTGLSTRELHAKIRRGEITLGGHGPSKIFGTLYCRSGRLMKREHRVFFNSVAAACQLGYRPCACCLQQLYHTWKHDTV